MSTIKFEDIFQVTQYPAGEPHIEMKVGNRYKATVSQGDNIICKTKDFNDLALIREGARILARNKITLNWVIPYFPFARHDRRRSRFDGLELEIAIDFMNGLHVTVIDPHSDVVGNAFRSVHQAAFVKECINAGMPLNNLGNGDVIYAIPDAGATKKADYWARYWNVPTVQCIKKRDVNTGELSGFQVLNGERNLNGSHVVIVDDICDGGGTFLGLAGELYALGANRCSLAVTHGLFTKGLDDLKKSFHRIYTLDTCEHDDKVLTKIPTSEVIRSFII